MKFYGLMIAVLLLAALSGVLYWSNKHPTADDTSGGDTSSTGTLPKLVSLNRDDITKIDLKKKDQDAIALTKDASGQWQMTAPKALGADQSTVHDIITEFSSLAPERLIDEKASDLSAYGLAPADIEIDLTEKDNKTQKVLLGDNVPTGGTTYIALAGDPHVYTISIYAKSTVNKSANELRDRLLLHINADKLTSLELTAKNQTVEFDHKTGGWQIAKPKPQRADPVQMEVLLNNLEAAKFDASAADNEKEAAAAFASGTPVAIAKLTTGTATQELQVRKSNGDYYAKSSVVDGVFKVSSDIGQTVDKGLADFQDRRLFDLNLGDPDEGAPGDVEKVEIHDGAKAYFLTRSGREWWSNGVKVDTVSVQYLLEAIRNLSATKFVDSGYTQPALDVTVTSGGGKVVQKSSIAKNGSDYIAKREGDTTMYELDAPTVEAVQTMAAKVKPTPEAK